MSQETWTKDQFWAELDKLGEDIVRERLIGKVWGDVGHRRAFAEEWLRVREQARISASSAEQIRIARSAKNAAWAAAIAAIIAAICAIIVSLSK